MFFLEKSGRATLGYIKAQSKRDWQCKEKKCPICGSKLTAIGRQNTHGVSCTTHKNIACFSRSHNEKKTQWVNPWFCVFCDKWCLDAVKTISDHTVLSSFATGLHLFSTMCRRFGCMVPVLKKENVSAKIANHIYVQAGLNYFMICPTK